jgi:hypothetical protein
MGAGVVYSIINVCIRLLPICVCVLSVIAMAEEDRQMLGQCKRHHDVLVKIEIEKM